VSSGILTVYLKNLYYVSVYYEYVYDFQNKSINTDIHGDDFSTAYTFGLGLCSIVTETKMYTPRPRLSLD